jgi:uncharacterized membrane protein YidH (DUF202 family)
MGIVFIITGSVLMAIARIKRWARVVKGKEKIFGGYTLNEAIIQWVGVIVLIIGFAILLSN